LPFPLDIVFGLCRIPALVDAKLTEKRGGVAPLRSIELSSFQLCGHCGYSGEGVVESPSMVFCGKCGAMLQPNNASVENPLHNNYTGQARTVAPPVYYDL
jgi:hypothetical protein